MKKIALKISVLIGCVVVIVFLLLPFLETVPPQTGPSNPQQPQISTENPLVKLAKRLGTVFSRKERPHTFAARSSAESQSPWDESLYASVGSTMGEATPAETVPSKTIDIPLSEEDPFDYADASFQTDDGEWVLIRQTAPQSSAPGMHEVNVHENPYDRYVKQERASRVHSSTPVQEIPDSKWARLTRPIKYLFSGNESPRPVQPTSMQVLHSDTAGALLASARTPNRAGDKTSSYKQMHASLPDITPLQWAQLTPAQREKIAERHAAHEFAQLLSGDRAAEQAAEIAADAKYPNPKNEQEKQQKEAYKKQITEENKQQIKQGLLARIQANAADKEAVDELAHMTGCKDSSLPSDSTECSAPETILPTMRTPQGILRQQQFQNAQNFFDQTKYVLPQNLPFTVVLGPTDPENLQNMANNPATQLPGEMYPFMYNQQECDSRPCYWVPNFKQADPQLADAFFTINDAHLKTDPLHTYATYINPFLQQKAKQAGGNVSPEEYARWQQQMIDNPPNWVPYTEEQLLQMHQNTKEALTQTGTDLSAGKEPVFPFVTDPAIAPQIAELIGPASFVYNNISLVNSTTAVEAGEQMTDSLIQNVNDAKEVFNGVTQGAISEGLRTQINQQISTQNQSGGGFAGLLNLFKKSTQK